MRSNRYLHLGAVAVLLISMASAASVPAPAAVNPTAAERLASAEFPIEVVPHPQAGTPDPAGTAGSLAPIVGGWFGNDRANNWCAFGAMVLTGALLTATGGAAGILAVFIAPKAAAVCVAAAAL